MQIHTSAVPSSATDSIALIYYVCTGALGFAFNFPFSPLRAYRDKTILPRTKRENPIHGQFKIVRAAMLRTKWFHSPALTWRSRKNLIQRRKNRVEKESSSEANALPLLFPPSVTHNIVLYLRWIRFFHSYFPDTQVLSRLLLLYRLYTLTVTIRYTITLCCTVWCI